LEDVKKLGVKNWWTDARDREAWRKIMWEAKTNIGL
jgi:hypothetical protein